MLRALLSDPKRFLLTWAFGDALNDLPGQRASAHGLIAEEPDPCRHCGRAVGAPDVVWTPFAGYVHRSCWEKDAPESN